MSGLTVSDANSKIRVTVKGLAELIATDNGDATDLVSFVSTELQAFHGLYLAPIKARTEQNGVIKVRVESGGLKSTDIILGW